MKKIIQRNVLATLNSKMILAVSAFFVLVSCGTQMGGYSETDGVYYDPNKDTLPEGVVYEDNRVGETYNYDDSTHVEDVRSRDWKENSKYWDEESQNSDWGAYAGTQTNYYNDYWGWGSPWGYYSPYWGSRFGMSFSFGWGFKIGVGTDPFWYGYSPYGYYNSYWGGWNSPYYYGYNSPYYYGYAPMYKYQRSGANGRIYNSYQGGQLRPSNNGFRNAGSTYRSPQTTRSNSDTPRYRTPQNRNAPQQNSDPRYVPRQRQEPRFNETPRSPQPTRSNDGGFRSGGFNGGGSSSSGGGFRSSGSSSSGGSTRSGGFR